MKEVMHNPYETAVTSAMFSWKTLFSQDWVEDLCIKFESYRTRLRMFLPKLYPTRFGPTQNTFVWTQGEWILLQTLEYLELSNVSAMDAITTRKIMQFFLFLRKNDEISGVW